MENYYKASCPVCGRNLFRGAANSVLLGVCNKCKAYLKITFLENGVITTVEMNRPFAEENS